MTEEKTIEQQNEMIARFMEVERDVNTWRHPYGATVYLIGGYWLPAKKLKYHSSWEWLMPVVEKIESLYYGGLQFYIKDSRAYIEVATQASTAYGDIPDVPNCYSGFSETKLNAVYKTVCDFIKWYTAYIEKQPTTQNQGV